MVLSCLRDNLDELRGEQCKEEVTYFIRMEVRREKIEDIDKQINTFDMAVGEQCKIGRIHK